MAVSAPLSWDVGNLRATTEVFPLRYARRAEKPETDLESRLKQRRPQESSLFSTPACALIRPYPDDAR